MQSSIDILAMFFNTSEDDDWPMTTFATLIGLALFAWLVYVLAPTEGERTFFRAEQFRLAAPLGGVLDGIESHTPTETDGTERTRVGGTSDRDCSPVG
ncbi:hypothetical protein ABH922_003645 [Rhodococcus sp. 27YEA15]|uniref:hypothetical protein n=1 Tax=Rhodococcus sp. 27YEA15 TaxID=3156259 RepID=UPI003C7C4CE5